MAAVDVDEGGDQVERFGGHVGQCVECVQVGRLVLFDRTAQFDQYLLALVHDGVREVIVLDHFLEEGVVGQGFIGQVHDAPCR